MTDPRIQDLLASKFAPEFISRLMNVVLFNPLDDEVFSQIAKIAIEKALKQVVPQLRGAQVKIENEEALLRHFASEALSTKQGARALRGLINKIINPLMEYFGRHPQSEQFTIKFEGGAIEITG